MGVEISEITPGELETVQQLCASWASDEAIEPLHLTLAARLDGEIIGAAFCEGSAEAGYTNRIVVDPAQRGGDVPRRLLDCAIEKLSVSGVHRCQMDVTSAADAGRGAEEEKAAPGAPSTSGGEGLWQSVLWRDRPSFDDEANVVRVMGRYA